MADDEAHQELRRAVRAVLKSFSDSYWRALDQERAYPEAFVQAMTAAGERSLARVSGFCGVMPQRRR